MTPTPKQFFWQTVIRIILDVLLLIIVAGIFYALLPELETRFRPVTSHFTLESAERVEGGTKAVFRYTKYRNCDPQGSAWYIGDLDTGFRQLIVERMGPGTPRPLGTQFSSPILLRDITPEDLAGNVFAELFSRCHTFWLTRTKIFPPE